MQSNKGTKRRCKQILGHLIMHRTAAYISLQTNEYSTDALEENLGI